MRSGSQPGFFQIELPDHLYFSLCTTFKRYCDTRAKSSSDLFFLVIGIAHLREWISPGIVDRLKKETFTPSNDHEEFAAKLSKLPEFLMLYRLGNSTKHQGKTAPYALETKFGLPIDDWTDIDSHLSFDDGPPSGHFIEGVDVTDILSVVLTFYREWFKSNSSKFLFDW